MHNRYLDRVTSTTTIRSSVYDSAAEMIFGRCSGSLLLHDSPNELHWLNDLKFGKIMRSREEEKKLVTIQPSHCMQARWKGDGDQDRELDLSLNIGPNLWKRERDWKNEEEEEEEVDSSLSLSLFSSSRKEKGTRDIERASKLRKMEGNGCSSRENDKVTSTLDLTI